MNPPVFNGDFLSFKQAGASLGHEVAHEKQIKVMDKKDPGGLCPLSALYE